MSHTLMIQVSDVDATVQHAVAHGAELTRPVSDHPYGRTGVVKDPFGHRWMVITPPDRTAQESRTG
ncbi:MAG: VOC family protein [Pseudonocardiaceae bacterium]